MNCSIENNCYDCRDNSKCVPFQEYLQKQNEYKKVSVTNMVVTGIEVY